MPVFDASSLIYAWDNYPEPQFPAVWEWIASQFTAGGFVLPSVAHEEVGYKTPECVDWLRAHAVTITAISNSIIQEATRVKSLLGIVDDRYSPKGVDESDLFIIATAKLRGLELVSDEARQNDIPRIPANMKIPAVCALPTVAVPCLNFIELIKESEVVFR